MHRERLPAKMTVSEFQEKFEQLEPGQQFMYHVGELSCDRQRHNELDRLAEQALKLGTDIGCLTRPHTGTSTGSPPPSGEGKAILVQRVNGFGREYLIVKRQEQMQPLILDPPKRHVVRN